MTLRSRFQRTTALAAGAFVGLAAALTFAAPMGASARVPVVAATATLSSSVSCIPEGWTVSWTLETAFTKGADGVFSNVKSSIPELIVPPGRPGDSGEPQPLPTPPPLTTFVDGGKVTGDGEITEAQSFTWQAATVELKLTVTWPMETGGYVTSNPYAIATAPDCPAPQPTGSVEPPPPLPGLGPDESDTGVGAPGQSSAPSSPSPSPSPNRTAEPAGTGRGVSGGGLALTGAAAGSLGVGAVLFVMARRRKMKFTV